jgi:hypothetical protein
MVSPKPKDASIFVCPMPRVWVRIHTQLKEYWQKNNCMGSEPPKPLFLSAWSFSSDIDKQECWEATIQWAKDRDLAESCIISEEQGYYVHELNTHRYGENWNLEPQDPAQKPDHELITEKLAKLKDDWNSIAGIEIAAHTRPVRFSGKKRRRLVISKDESDFNPPWGSWWTIKSHRKEAFSLFRRAVNKAIDPHHIDHIDFI